MVLSEVTNALLLTYIATEYSIRSSSIQGFSWKKFCQSIWNRIWMMITILLYVADRYASSSSSSSIPSTTLSKILLHIRSYLEFLYHTPKIMLVALLYMMVLYVDCRRFTTTASSSSTATTTWTIRSFLSIVGIEFLKILPLYPFMAVVISCGFMLLVGFCETLHLPVKWLNWPIYYGTLYGPFTFVYLQVKRRIIRKEEQIVLLPYRYRH